MAWHGMGWHGMAGAMGWRLSVPFARAVKASLASASNFGVTSPTTPSNVYQIMVVGWWDGGGGGVGSVDGGSAALTERLSYRGRVDRGSVDVLERDREP